MLVADSAEHHGHRHGTVPERPLDPGTWHEARSRWTRDGEPGAQVVRFGTR